MPKCCFPARVGHRFEGIVIGDELPHGKPQPMPYLEGLRTLSIAFEDILARAFNPRPRQALRLWEYGRALAIPTWSHRRSHDSQDL
jgi:hypothetical protein